MRAYQPAWLGRYYPIRVSAPTLPTLVARLHPDLMLGERDFLWATVNSRGATIFTLDEAKPLEMAPAGSGWALVDDRRRIEDYTGGDLAAEDPALSVFGDQNLRAVVPVIKKRPSQGDRSGDGAIGPKPYALVVGHRCQGGIVYEIGWPCDPAGGDGAGRYERLFYVLKTPTSKWVFIGEGPTVDVTPGGCDHHELVVADSSVSWRDGRDGMLAPEVHFKVREILEPWFNDDFDTDFVIGDESVLAPPFPAHLSPSIERYYVKSNPGETLAAVAARCAQVLPLDSSAPKSLSEAEAARRWYRNLMGLNPGLSFGKVLPAGSPVSLPILTVP